MIFTIIDLLAINPYHIYEQNHIILTHLKKHRKILNNLCYIVDCIKYFGFTYFIFNQNPSYILL